MSNLKVAYAASSQFTITLASLGNSTTVGRQSTVVDNSSNLYLDYLVGGLITCGTNTAGAVIEVYAFAAYNDTPTYPDVLGASDAGVTFTSRDSVFESMRPISIIVCEGTTNRGHWIPPTSIAQVFGGWIPFKWGVAVINSSGNALNSTGGNHALYYKPIYTTVT